MKKWYRIIFTCLLIIMLALVRVLEDHLFFSPTMDFFRNIYASSETPGKIPQRVFWNISLRYWINSIISLAIIWMVFQEKGYLRFGAILYALLFLILLPLFILMIPSIRPGEYQEIYYVRRFLIHPVLILILLPAFYYQQLKNRQYKRRSPD